MSDPSLAVQKAVVARLKASAALSSLVAGRILDRAPDNVTFPFVQIGYFDTIDDSAECIDGCQVRIEINVWSREPGQTEAKTIAGHVRAALHEHALPLEEPFAMVGNVEHENSRPQGDGDGITTRIIVSFLAWVENT